MVRIYYYVYILFLLLCLIPIPAKSQEQKWPDLPLLTITTEDKVDPSFTIVNHPEGCVGISLMSEHIPGRLTITLKGDTLYDSGDYIKGTSGIRIKIRGNTTGVYSKQKPYKIKLSKKSDILSFDDANYKSKDWALLPMRVWNVSMKSSESNILPFTGFALCRTLDFEWVPRTRYVNVILNDKYIGLYNLTETVERADNRVITDKTGFLIENDAYWWKDGENYFKTEHQNSAMGYTFKYPESDEITDERKEAISTFMNKVEKAIFSHKDISNYIDMKSFARWILAHDILGTLDAAGSNMYLYKDNLSDDASNSSKLKMSTLWGFDSSFLVDSAQWSNEHTLSIFYYPELFKESEFIVVYKDLFEQYKGSIYPKLEDSLNDLCKQDSAAFNQSRLLHRQVFPYQCPNTLDEQKDEILSLIKKRIHVLEVLVKKLGCPQSDVNNAHADNTVKLIKRLNSSGIDFTNKSSTNLCPGIYIEKYTNGTTRKIIR